jgi:pectinesterase
MRHTFSLFCLFLFLSAFQVGRQRPITIFLIGDSTMANKDLAGGNPERGWGQMLPHYLCGELRIDNHARNGRSSKSFIDEGLWEQVRSSIQRGDYVFIQFGHNDEKPDTARHTDPGTTFDANLRRYVRETRERGGIPVLFNSIVRRHFVAGKLVDTHGAYLDSPRNVAREMDVPFVDLNKLTHDLVEPLGPDASKKLFMWVAPNTVPLYPQGREDDTHLNEEGASAVAKLAAHAVAREVPALAAYVHGDAGEGKRIDKKEKK